MGDNGLIPYYKELGYARGTDACDTGLDERLLAFLDQRSTGDGFWMTKCLKAPKTSSRKGKKPTGCITPGLKHAWLQCDNKAACKNKTEVTYASGSVHVRGGTYHPWCVGISGEEYAKLNHTSSGKWICPVCAGTMEQFRCKIWES